MAPAAAQYYFRFHICWCQCLQKVKIYHQTKLSWHISIHGWDITASGMENKLPPYWNSTSVFDFDHFPVICKWFCIRLLNFVQMGALAVEIWRHIYLSRCRPRPLNTTSGFVFVDVTALRRSKSISKPNLVDISPFAAEILLFSFWNSTSGFDFDLVICISLCIRLPYFVQIGAPTAEIWRHIHFLNWQWRPLNTTSSFVFVDVTAFRRSKSISKPNFVDISQFTVEI